MSTEVNISQQLARIAQSLAWESPESLSMLPPRICTFQMGDLLFFREESFLKFPHVSSSTDQPILVTGILENRVEMQLLELVVPGSRLVVLPGNLLEKYDEARVKELLRKYRGIVSSTKYDV